MKIMWLIFALGAALTAAIVVVLSKAGMKHVDSSLVFALQAVLILIVSWAFVFSQGKHTKIAEIDSRTWIYLAFAGVLTTVSSLLSFRALKLQDAAISSPVQHIALVFAIILAVIFLKEKISWQIVLGAIFMVAGAILIALAKKAA